MGEDPAALHGREAERRRAVRRPLAACSTWARRAPDAELPVHTANVDGPELWMAWRLPPAHGVAAARTWR